MSTPAGATSRPSPASTGPVPPVQTIFPSRRDQPAAGASPDPADELPVLPEAIDLPPLPK
jgi:hypothetical protein